MTTPQTPNFDRISPTALLVACARQMSGLPYTREIVELTDAFTVVKQFLALDNQTADKLASGAPVRLQTAIGAALIEARYRAIEQGLARFRPTQILELASGLLPRGMIWSENPEITFVESDLPTMIEQKQQVVEHLIGSRPNLHFQAIDSTQRPNPLLCNAVFDAAKPLAIVCEGLLMYLTFAEKQQVCANVRELLQTYGGVWITSDFSTLEDRQRRHQHEVMQQIDAKIASATGRAFADNEFATVDHAKQFVAAQGFQVEAFSRVDVIDQLQCLAGLDIDRGQFQPLLTVPIFALTLATH